MKERNKINKPIFIIGCPRSGTGIFHQLLRLHPDIAWITPVTNRCFSLRYGKFYEKPSTAKIIQDIVRYLPDILVPKKYSGPYDGSLKIKFQYETNEGHAIWNSFCPLDDHYLDEKDLSDEAVNYFREVVRGHLEIFNKSRFVNKMPHNSMRIRYINGIFPDAKFIHILRDGRAVVNSLLKRRRLEKGSINNWWATKPKKWREYRKLPGAQQSAYQWRDIIKRIKEDRKYLKEDQYYEFKYENLIEKTNKEMKKIISFLELSPEKYFKENIVKYFNQLESRNFKWSKNLSKKQKKNIMSICEDLLKEYNYI